MSESAGSSVFLEIFRSIGGGKRVAVLISAFFDESSEGNSQNGLLAVCGYALDPSGLKKFTPAWRAMLLRYGLPYFRMTDCNSNSGVFKNHSSEDCEKCARRAIKIARAYPLVGYAYVLDQSVYKKVLQDNGFDCDPYSFLVWGAFVHVNTWVEKHRPDHKISLFFEAGYETQPRAHDLLTASLKRESKSRVVSVGFVRKEEAEAAQAGDLIAWHVRKGFQNRNANRNMRKDFAALIENKSIRSVDHTAEQLERLRTNLVKKFGTLEKASKALFSLS